MRARPAWGIWILACALICAAPSARGALSCESDARADFARNAPVSAKSGAACERGEPHVNAVLLVDDREPLRAGVWLQIDPGWHVYGRDPGVQTRPTRVQWSLARGDAAPTHWPAPETFESFGESARGYSREVLLSSQLRVDAQRGDVQARVSFIACEKVCIPGEVQLSRPLAGGAPGEAAALFDRLAADTTPASDKRAERNSLPGVLAAALLAATALMLWRRRAAKLAAAR